MRSCPKLLCSTLPQNGNWTKAIWSQKGLQKVRKRDRRNREGKRRKERNERKGRKAERKREIGRGEREH